MGNSISNKLTKDELEKEYQAMIISIRGYIQDSKVFDFEPIELPQMQMKAFNLQEKINNYEK